MTSHYRSTTNFVAVAFATLMASCASIMPQDDVLTGTILFPFVQQTDVIGQSAQQDKFVLKSTVGNSEYTIEIPDAARDYDLVVPLADIKSVAGDGGGGALKERVDIPPASSTDKELISEFPVIQGRNPEDTALTDAAFGVGSADGPTQSPSYSMKLARITDLYKQRQFEYALIEVNDLLAYFPNSPRLYKMKGTILVKLRNLDLAVGAWIRASELDPMDGRIKKAIASLEKKIDANKRSAAAIDVQRSASLNDSMAPKQPSPSNGVPLNQPANGVPSSVR